MRRGEIRAMDILSEIDTGVNKWVLRSENRQDIPLIGTCFVGRDPEAEICIPDDRISRRHAKIQITVAGAIVEDLGSGNGTIINGRRIDQVFLLKSGDKIKFHMMEFSLVNIVPAKNHNLMLHSKKYKDIALIGRLTVGRGEGADICIVDHRISRKHATIEVTRSGVVVDDLGSINGTYINGFKVERPTLIKEGDSLCFHEREYTVTKAYDPDATRICGVEEDSESTRCDRIIVNGTKLKPSASVAKPMALAQAAPVMDEVLSPKINLNKKPSAIQNQLEANRPTTHELLKRVGVGTWVQFERGYGKYRSYCLVSAGDSKNQVYSFLKKSGFGLTRMSSRLVAAGLADGSIKILDKKPILGRFSFFFAGTKN
jgi:pSer/pThr/pTyr-binding forkhead associated (FHA) protein